MTGAGGGWYSVLDVIRPATRPVIVEALFLAALCFIITLILGRPLINWLERKGVRKKVNKDLPATHLTKMGTPTMGGLMILASVFIVNAIFNLYDRYSMLLPLGTVVTCGALGVVDDLLSLQHGKRMGIRARVKFGWIFVFSVAAALTLYYALRLDTMNVPFVGEYSLGAWYIPIAVFVILGTSNAVNLTDGLDTLAAGLLAMSFTGFGIIAFLQGHNFVTPLCFTTVGALLAFIWYNAHPAQVFMGDTGALALGALLAVVAFMTGQWLLLPVVGIVFVAEALSVILQVGYFKLTKGRRLLKGSPLHHHFDQLGGPETQTSMRFWIVGMVATMVGVALALS